MHLNRTFARRYAAILIALSLTSPIAARAASPEPASTVTSSLASIRIDNFAQVTTNYYRGAQPQGADYAQLAAAGIKTVINLTSDDAEATEPAMVERAGMKYVQIPMTTHDAPTAKEIEGFLHIVNDPAQQPVYVHCVGGRHRTGVMTAIYRMTDEGWTAERAFSEMKQYKYGADFLHPEFKQFVYAYQPRAAAPVTMVAAVAAVN